MNAQAQAQNFSQAEVDLAHSFKDQTGSWQGALYFLQDGEALAQAGISDQDLVEGAYAYAYSQAIVALQAATDKLHAAIDKLQADKDRFEIISARIEAELQAAKDERELTSVSDQYPQGTNIQKRSAL